MFVIAVPVPEILVLCLTIITGRARSPLVEMCLDGPGSISWQDQGQEQDFETERLSPFP